MMSQRKPVIGLAGGIGAGKSAVAGAFAQLGCLVVDSDALGREALTDPVIRHTLVGWWGQRILGSDGEVDRGKVAQIVFADPEQRQRLEGLTHPWIESKRKEQFAAADRSTVAFVIDAPLLFEAGIDDECDAIVFVDAPRAERVRRVRAHRGWSESELFRRESSQLSLDEKRKRADYVIENTGDLSALAEKVRLVLERILAA